MTSFPRSVIRQFRITDRSKTPRATTKGSTMKYNNESNAMCDGSGPHDPGRVRLLPGAIPDHGNMILCRCCFERELAWRRERNRELSKDCAFKLPGWLECAIYGEGGAA